jgi:phosphoglucosamine mutase
MALRFGTDGVRGRAPGELGPEFVRVLGRIAAGTLGPGPFLVGRDTRSSGPLLETAFVAGLADSGAKAIVLGMTSTPSVAWLAAADGLPAAMISASHNPHQDNGIKLFAAGGRKLTDAVQDEIQAHLDRELGVDESRPPPAGNPPPLGDSATQIAADASVRLDRYRAAVEASIGGRRLDGMSVVIDCANGSNSVIAPEVLRDLGAVVQVHFADPNGRNINDGCGSTHPGVLQEAVVASGADIGLAFDGDADRVLAVDHAGRLIDGDQLIALCAIDRADRGQLPTRSVVVTVMANLGFRMAMADRGIALVETPVGDRYVLEALESSGGTLGGEQSGHIIFRDLATTGDGLLTGVQVMDVMARSGRSLADLADAAMTRYPQVLRNVRLTAPVPGLLERLAPAVRAAETTLGTSGRVLVRESGTEPLIRVMVEATDAATAEQITDELLEEVVKLTREPPVAADTYTETR